VRSEKTRYTFLRIYFYIIFRRPIKSNTAHSRWNVLLGMYCYNQSGAPVMAAFLRVLLEVSHNRYENHWYDADFLPNSACLPARSATESLHVTRASVRMPGYPTWSAGCLSSRRRSDSCTPCPVFLRLL
jgi:hypothetical protein